ncbi:MAG TPA: ATP-binding protein [Rudaea sp.]|nr:ATP-binding protein [Rudaea sp.]
MSLRFKLLLIALSTLALPLAGWLFVRQMEELLRHGQEQTLIASARALARSLGAIESELPPPGAALYVHAANERIAVDGFSDDWAAMLPYAQNVGASSDAQKLKLLLCENSEWLYLLAIARDTTRDRADARDESALRRDHLTLTLGRGDASRRYLLASAAPGSFDARTLDDDTDGGDLPVHLSGALQEDSSGYRIELRLPRAQAPDRLALALYDSAAPGNETVEPRRLLTPSALLSEKLAQFAPDAMRARLLSSEGWVIAESGRLEPGKSEEDIAAGPARRRWFENIVYRSLIAPGMSGSDEFATSLPRLNAPEVWQALSGIAATAWHPAPTEDQVVLAAAVPLRSAPVSALPAEVPLTPPSAPQTVPPSPAARARDYGQSETSLTPPSAAQTVPPSPAARARDDGGQPAAANFSMGEVRGALLLEQAGDALPLLTNRALLLLIGASLFALLLAGGILFAFASVLGLRIRRLRNAAERALRAGGQVDTAVLPLIGARDELGDLARSFARLLDEVNAYTDYLRTLASKLSHELQTPLAIVKSSLDNLDHQAVPPEARTYLARARDGAERLGAIVRAMSEASRMERAIVGVEGEDFDLAAVLRGCVEAYGPLAAPRRVDGDIPAAPMIMHGAPELIAQALDKLFDNARSFAPDDGWIRLSLRAGADGAEIRVANSGPLLPPAMQERLFDSLVSVRPSAPVRPLPAVDGLAGTSAPVRRSGEARADAPHLGLGLYVVRMIADLHRGEARARNLADGSGVEFTIVLRGMPRRPLAGAA